MIVYTQKESNEDNALLLRVGRGKNDEIIGQEAAAKLLGQITRHASNGDVSYKVPVSALEKADSSLEIWDHAAMNGLIHKVVDCTEPYYEIMHISYANDNSFENRFIKFLEAIAGAKHEEALATAAKYRQAKGEGKAR